MGVGKKTKTHFICYHLKFNLIQFKLKLFLVHNDERSICQLCRTKNDRRSRASSTQNSYAQNKTTHSLASQVYVRQAHTSQVGEISFEK